jgi:C-terminal processing protease CtpA/Prc
MTLFNKKHLFPGLASGLIALLCCCTPEELPVPPDAPEEQAANEWIENTMRRYYLWTEEIPRSEALDLTEETEAFFYSLLTLKDGKTQSGSHYYYSYIDKKTPEAGTKSYQGDGYSFGFEFQYYIIAQNPAVYALQVLYVLPGSPADEAGIQRGDWIMEIGGKPVPSTSQSLIEALEASSSVTVSFGITRTPGATTTHKSLTAAVVTDNPVFVAKTIRYGNRKVAYLVYNHFTAGPTDQNDDELFNNTLRQAFKDFKAEGIDAFVLDLRYNGGGLVSCAQLLATLLAPASALNDVFCKLSYNGQSDSYTNQELKLESKYLRPGGENLDLQRLYVITSQRTASASEAVINGLKPYLGDQLILVGETTEGKNVGSVTFSDALYDWELHPIVSRLSNKDGFSDYENGFLPDYPCEEKYAETFYNLGDEREYVLKPILDHIAYGTSLQWKTRSAFAPREGAFAPIPLYHSLERKQTAGVIIDR